MGPSLGSVWVDGRGTQSIDYAERGIGRYIGEQVSAVTRVAPGVIDAVHLDPVLPVPAALEPLLGSGLLLRRPDRIGAGAELPAVNHVASPMELTTPLDELWPLWARSERVKTVVTLYDLIPLIHREWYLDPFPLSRATYFARLGLLGRADHALAISQRTAADAVELLGIPDNRITVVDCGVSQRFSSLLSSEAETASLLAREIPRLREGFLLYVGGDDPRKNLQGAIRGYGLLPPELRRAHQLVIVCKLAEPRIAELTAYAEQVGVSADDLLFTGYVTDAQLAALYRSCDLFVFPSLYEGAGLPILEAMSCGAPVAASGTSSIPEILGDLEATFDPADDADIASCLQRVLGSPAQLDSLRERSRRRVELHTWDRVAERTLEGYERALAAPARPTSRGRKRLAMVTPWPPQWTGIATHSRQVVEKLTDHAEVDVIVPVAENGIEYNRSLEPEVRLFTADEFDWADGLRGYDRVLYTLGGSPFHVHAYEALMKRPGAVLAHDVFLLGLYAAVGESRVPWDPTWLEHKLVELYGDRISLWDRRCVWEPRVCLGQEVFMTQEIQMRAEQVIVHSEYQRDILRLEAPRGGAATHVAPLGIPEPPAVGEPPPREHPGPVLVTLGLVSVDAKRMDLLLEGLAELRRDRLDVTLQVVGELIDSERERLGALITRLELGDSVELLGRVSRERYWQTLRAADAAVQLRDRVKGPSAAVNDCIAARVPVLASSIGSLREIPEPVVLPVPEDCSARTLAEKMAAVLGETGLREEIGAAQERYAEENSFARVAERYAELLGL